MSIVLITGSAGLIGSEATHFFHERGFDIVGVDNNMRQYFFGKDGSTTWNREQLEDCLANYHHRDADIRDTAAIDGGQNKLFGHDLVITCDRRFIQRTSPKHT